MPEKRTRRSKATTDRPIVVASNRLPLTFHRGPRGLERKASSGGLVSALEPVIRKRGGTWIGWPGIEVKPRERIAPVGKSYRIAPVLLSETEVNRYYHGFSNRTLWPLMHSLPDRARFERRDWETYQQVNERFGEVAREEGADAGLVWIHDYHLMLAPLALRREGPEAQLGFFLHIPFPPHDIFRLCPWDRDLLAGLLACDLIGFHVSGYAQNFLDCVERRLGARVDRGEMLVEYGDRIVRVGVFPIGIDYEEFEARAERAPASPGTREQVVLGVDRLDYTKGIPERIRAFERLLELHPRHRENVVLIQLAVPSRSQVSEYRELKREIDELVGRVNGRFATATWSPIRYLYRSMNPDRLAALYRDADVGLVTPLRDGMNLVAKEFVACQVEDSGVVVLSAMAGAAETMREALIVNPYNIDETAEAIHRALTMEEAERRSRMVSLRRRERRDDVDAWVRTFLEAAIATPGALTPVQPDEFETWLSPILKRYRVALFLDYDGTLAPIAEHPAKARLSAAGRAALEACAGRKDTDVTIVSGRSLRDVRKMVGQQDLVYAGNHGLEISGPGVDDYEHEDLVHYREKTDEVTKLLEEVAVDGAWTEGKGPTLTYHFRAVPPPRREALAERARALITEAGYQARNAHCAIEGRPPIGWDKGRAVLHILRNRYGPRWSEDVRVVYVGDDDTDEDAFRTLAGLGMTFRVGSADTPTFATRRLPDVASVHTLLTWIGQRQLPGPNA